MAKSWRQAVGFGLLLVSAIAGCGAPEKGDSSDEPTVQTRSGALTTSLFQPQVAYPTGSMPEAVAIGDLDGDGRNDVALLTSYYFDAANDYTVHVFLQASDGSLKPRVKYPVGSRSSSIDIGDVNGDGRADVVVGLANGSGISIGVLLQNASGTLDPMVSYPTVNSYQVKIGDFNSDGRMDVAGINWGSYGDGVDVLLQTETGTLAAPVTYHAPHGGYDELDAGDIDGDGRTDLVVMSGQMYAIPDVSVLLQTADGVFGAPTSYALSGNVNTAGVALGDTNGDGRTDIVVSAGGNRPNSIIARFLQNEEGGMDPAVSYPSHDIPSAMVMADVDGDGRKDVLVTHSGWARLGVYRQYPSGDFVNEELVPIGSASHYKPQALAVGDINGDGRPDAVIADSNSGLVVLRHVNDDSLALAVTAPSGGPFYTNVPLTIRWTVGDAFPLAGFDVSVSVNSGASYAPIAGCTGLPATARECAWTPSGPAVSGIRVRVTARTSAGQTASSETTFNLLTPSLTVTLPVSTTFVGTTTNIQWVHNLPAGGTVRIELSRDGGSSFEILADAAPNTGSGMAGTFSWNVTGPNTGTARVRVTANGSLPASSTGNNFSIVQRTLTVTVPEAGATVYTTALSVAWTHNLGGVATTVRIELSRDGGSTFETIAAAAPISVSFNGSVSGPDTTDALIRVTTNGAVTVTGTSASFTLVAPTLTVTRPVAGEVLYAGTPLAITWSTNLPANRAVNVELSRDGGNTIEFLAMYVPNTGSLAWVVTGPSTGTARVRVTVAGSPGASSDTFAIVEPSLIVTSPAAGATLYAGASVPINWSTNLPAELPVDIALSRDGGATFEPLAAGVPNTGSFAWTVTGPDAAIAVVRVTVSGPLPVSNTSGPFAITTPALTVTAPLAGALAYAGMPVTITWTDNLPAGDPVSIEVSRDGGATFEPIAADVPNTGSFVWSVTGPDAAEARVRVTSIGAMPASGMSAAFQIVTATIAVTSPTAGASWAIGTARTISWASSNLPAGDTVRVELSRNGGASWTTLAAAAPATGSLPWTASAPATTAAIVRVSANGSVPAVGTSGAFSIGSPAVAVTSPAAGASWVVGTAQVITWNSNLLPTSTVKVQLSRNGGSTFTTLNAAAPNTGSFAWTVTGAASTTAIVRVVANGASVSGVSGTFSLVAGSVTVTAPNTAVIWTIGSVRTITWSHNAGPGAQFQIEVSRSGVWSVIAAAVPGNGATSGSHDWTVTGPATNKAKVRVTWTANTAAKDASDVTFQIK